jgi:hypothetical protein
MNHIKSLFEKEPSSMTLYHYTTQTGLCGIIDNEQLWATNVLYVNDNKELTYSFDLILNIISDLKNNNTIDESVLKNIEIDLRAQLVPSYIYVFSLSESGDLLSQWRGFSSREVKKNIGDCVLLPCVYKPTDQKNILRELILCTKVGDPRGPYELLVDTKNFGFGRTLFGTEDKCFLNWFFTLSSIIKHPSFAEEKEWRIIKHTLTQKPNIKFRQGKYSLIPYVEIKFDATTFPNILSEVIIGPTPYSAASIFSLQEKLFQKYLTQRHIIRSSKIPFREW